MFLQLPLVSLTSPFEKRKTPAGRLLGNSVFWLSFTIFGQPFAALMYFYAWQVSAAQSTCLLNQHGLPTI